MVSDPLFAAFLGYALLFAATPGSTTAVVVKNTLDGGRRAGLSTALGAACANATHATAAGLGGATLLRVWPGALEAVRLVGAAYLAYLGIRSGWLAVRAAPTLMTTLAPAQGMHHRSWREGLTVALLGPATFSFYLAAVPTFIRPSWPRGAYGVLAVCHVALTFGCHASWTLALHRLRTVLGRPGARRALGLATSVALLTLALRIVLR
ncbi:MAG: LysE family translocator [Vicinamibacterales bacterium]